MTTAKQGITPRGSISLWEKLGYGSGDLASNLVFQVVINFLSAYYTDTLLLDPARVAFIFGVVRLFDAITDPMMGAIADRTQTRWGQFRPWLLWLALPFGAAYLLAFSIGGIDDPAKGWAAFATYFILLLVYTAINIPYGALATAISPDPEERMSLRSWQFVMAQTGNIIVGAATMPLVAQLGGGDDVKGFQYAIGIYSVIAVVLFIVCFLSTRERITASGAQRDEAGNAPAEQKRTVSIWKDLYALIKNDQWVVLAAINFFLLIVVVMRGANTFYYTKYVLDAEAMFSVYLTLAALAAVVGSCVAGRFSGGLSIRDVGVAIGVGAFVLALIVLMGRTGLIVQLPMHETLISFVAIIAGIVISHFLGLYFDRVRAFCGLFVVQGVAMIALGFSGAFGAGFGLFMFVLAMFLGQTGVPVLWSMLSDCVDYGQRKTGIRNNGLVFSSALFSLKMGVTVAGVLGGLILARTGYVANEAQTEQAINGIVWAFAFVPAVGCFIVSALALLLKLTEPYVRIVQRDIGLATAEVT